MQIVNANASNIKTCRTICLHLRSASFAYAMHNLICCLYLLCVFHQAMTWKKSVDQKRAIQREFFFFKVKILTNIFTCSVYLFPFKFSSWTNVSSAVYIMSSLCWVSQKSTSIRNEIHWNEFTWKCNEFVAVEQTLNKFVFSEHSFLLALSLFCVVQQPLKYV